MASNLKLIMILALLLPVLACSSGGSKKGGIILLPKAGKVHEHISCSANTLFTYALYLPSACNNRFDKSTVQKRFPVILAFDPHGDGSLPVKRFSSLAGKYGFILMGSNDSKNMQSPAESEAVVRQTLHGIRRRLRERRNGRVIQISQALANRELVRIPLPQRQPGCAILDQFATHSF